jgi:hypothetical protein
VELPGCEHLEVDGWHVEGEAPEHSVDSETEPPRAWSLFDQIRVELGNAQSRGVWLALGTGLVLGVVYTNWFAVLFSLSLAAYFARQFPRLIRMQRHGRSRVARCQGLRYISRLGDTRIWHGHATVDGARVWFAVKCDQFETLLSEQGVECNLLVHPAEREAYLLGFRAASEESAAPEAPEAPEGPAWTPRATQPWRALVGSVALAVASGTALAFVGSWLEFAFEPAAFLVGFCAGIGARWGGRSALHQGLAVLATLVAYVGCQVLIVIVHWWDRIPPGHLGEAVSYASRAILEGTAEPWNLVSLGIALFVAWQVPRSR